MADPDLILLHAPSVYDFRKHPKLYGPVSDVVPSTQIFEMYPIGFLTMLEHLEQNGFSVRIINIALKMLERKKFDPEKCISKLKPAAFGIDLHWMVHAQGALELAKAAKKHHPDIPVIFGGLSASYYHEELIQYPQVDYVIRGDSAEEPLHQLMSALKQNKDVDTVPNLTWQKDGNITVNPLGHVPEKLDKVNFDYRAVMKSTVKYMDLFGHVPFKNWLKYPIVASLTCRGCIHNCVGCGGSSFSYQNICARKKAAFRDPETLAKDIGLISRYINAPVMVLGDLLQQGQEAAERFLDQMAKEKVKNHIALEFFAPPSREFLEKIARAIPHFDIQISPESHDEKVRKAFGRPYTNEAFEQFIQDAFDTGCSRVDIFFMIGLPFQTYDSVMHTIDYCRDLLNRFAQGEHKGKLLPFISPLAPFLDPGSRAFEDPEKHGYRRLATSLQEHADALLRPTWKHTLNYETEWLTRDEIASSTYESSLRLNRLKQEHGIVDPKEAGRIDERIRNEQKIMTEIDRIINQEGETSEKLDALLGSFDSLGPSTICRKDEMNWPVRFLRFNPFRITHYFVSHYIKKALQKIGIL